MSEKAIAYMNTAAPDSMAWLGWDEAHALGVRIDPFVEIVGDPTVRRTAPAPRFFGWLGSPLENDPQR